MRNEHQHKRIRDETNYTLSENNNRNEQQL